MTALRKAASEIAATTERHLHIISFDVPFPADYGGVIDVFYKLKALSEAGVHVHLHCYEYGRRHQPALENLCDEVHYYRRNLSWKHILSCRPYIVATRCSDDLVGRLLCDDYPILCEGIHTTALLSDNRLKDRKLYVRAHNVEHDYYAALGKAEPNPKKRLYYFMEAYKLRHYERILRRAAAIFPVSSKDVEHFSSKFRNVVLLPIFGASDVVSSRLGRGSYVLYHGNLSVRENADAASWLIKNVFARLDCPCVVAGRNPDDKLSHLADDVPNVTLVANPDDARMTELLQNAQVNVLVTRQATGSKLKLLNALYNGRFCLVNPEMVAGSGLEPLCQVCSPDGLVANVKHLLNADFTDHDIALRTQLLQRHYRKATNVNILLDTIFAN